MDNFLTAFFSIVFRILIGLFVLMLITGTFRRLFIKKNIKALLELPDEKREKLIHVYQKVISMWRIIFWAAPLYLLVIPISLLVIPAYLLPKINPNLFHQIFLTLTTAMIGSYVYVFEDFFYKKKLLKGIDKPTERETL
jgi:hypothetical protein